jgi:glutaredoxin
MGAAHTTSEYAEGSILSKLPQQDALAKDLLRKSGLKFDLVDLSNGIGTRLGARLKGVRQTPTLIDGNSPSRSYIGIREISRYISSDRTVEEN